MFFSTIQLRSFRISAVDGDAGYLDALVFSKGTWQCRYFAVRLDASRGSRNVILPMQVLVQADGRQSQLRLNVGLHAIIKSPEMDVATPVARRHEQELNRYFGWPPYWALEQELFSRDVMATSGYEHDISETLTEFQTANDMIGYHVQANDAELGELRDMLIDSETWEISFMVVLMERGTPAKVMPIEYVERVDWTARHIYADASRAEAMAGPDHNPAEPVSPEFQRQLQTMHNW